MENPKIINGILHAVVSFIFNKEKKVMMFLRKGEEWERGWEPIKGAVNINETDKEAALREIKEEAGLNNVKIIGKIPKVYWAEKPWKNGKLRIRAHVFVCKYINGNIKLGEPEHIDWKWMSIEEAKENIWIKNGKDMLKEAYDLTKVKNS
ncbi:MAG: NUDIX hydrolase [Nanoarchaeota archaeon]|nr:NUDIX hydrolase [Nanoarchaeota archaeon]MBU4284531.1 NUDIX hydrolase [Nanoarchaeota archaeon]